MTILYSTLSPYRGHLKKIKKVIRRRSIIYDGKYIRFEGDIVTYMCTIGRPADGRGQSSPS